MNPSLSGQRVEQKQHYSPRLNCMLLQFLAGSQRDCLHRKALLGVTTPKSGPQGVITALTQHLI